MRIVELRRRGEEKTTDCTCIRVNNFRVEGVTRSGVRSSGNRDYYFDGTRLPAYIITARVSGRFTNVSGLKRNNGHPVTG